MVGGQSMLMLLGVVLLLFGGKKLPELAGSLGKSMREFKKATESEGGDEEPAAPAALAVPPRACPSCRAVLEADWAHCPKCGAATPPGPVPAA